VILVVEATLSLSLLIYTSGIADLENRETRLLKTVLVVNLDVKDNHEEAAVGGKLALDLCQRVSVVISSISSWI
jgi:RNA polymerase II subunit A C-terminal domain phosphatase SSU72